MVAKLSREVYTPRLTQPNPTMPAWRRKYWEQVRKCKLDQVQSRSRDGGREPVYTPRLTHPNPEMPAWRRKYWEQVRRCKEDSKKSLEHAEKIFEGALMMMIQRVSGKHFDSYQIIFMFSVDILCAASMCPCTQSCTVSLKDTVQSLALCNVSLVDYLYKKKLIEYSTCTDSLRAYS